MVSLFTGAGGLDAGLERAGFSVVTCVEQDADCVATLLLNQAARIPIPGSARTYLSECRVLHADVRDLTADDLRPPDTGVAWRPDLLAGGPPCQPFSAAGKLLSLADPRGSLFREFVRLADGLQPRAILFENVRGLVTARGPTGAPGEALHIVKESFEALGYATRFALLNAADYGAPQRRVRLFMLGVRSVELPGFPVSTHEERPEPSLVARLRQWVSLGDFLATRAPPDESEVVRPTPRLAQLLAGVPPGSGLRSPGAREATRPGGHWGYRQGTFVAALDKPARTVTASATQDWLRLEDGSLRRLTTGECAALQGFPAGWRFAGGKASVFRQIGNAVEGKVAEALGRCLFSALDRPASSPRSAPLPREFADAIRYTAREQERNGRSRLRVRRLQSHDPVTARSLKGLGRARGSAHS